MNVFAHLKLLPRRVGLWRMNFFELLPHHMGEVPGGRRGTLSKRFVLSPSGPVGPPPPYDGGGIMSSEATCDSPALRGRELVEAPCKSAMRRDLDPGHASGAQP